MAAPTITSISPTHGPAGISVTIRGTDLAGAAVKFNDFGAAAVEVVSAAEVHATVPAVVRGSGPVSVTTPVGTAISADMFVPTVLAQDVATLAARLRKLYTDHPGICEHFTYGDAAGTSNKTSEGRELNYVRIGKQGIDQTERANRPAALIIAGVHAREWAPPEAVISFAENLLSAYNCGKDISYPALSHAGKPYGAFSLKNGDAIRIIERINLYVAPLVNPDGREFSVAPDTPGIPEGGDRRDEWRKNRRVMGGCTGVDVNRNYDVAWDFDQYFDMSKSNGMPNHLWDYDDHLAQGKPVTTKGIVQSSKGTTVCDFDIYRGPSSASEVETQFVQWLIDTKRIAFFLDVHAYGRHILYPSSTADDQWDDPSKNLRNSAWDHRRQSAGSVYGEFFPRGLHDSHMALAQLMADEILKPVRGTGAPEAESRYKPGQDLTLYQDPGRDPDPVPGSSDDYAFSRQITATGYDESRGPILAFTLECGYESPTEGGFHPHYVGALPKVEREVHLALLAFLRYASF